MADQEHSPPPPLPPTASQHQENIGPKILIPPERLTPPTPTNYDVDKSDSHYSPKAKARQYSVSDNEDDHYSPLAVIALKSQRARRAAAKLHKKVSRRIEMKHAKKTVSQLEMMALDNDLFADDNGDEAPSSSDEMMDNDNNHQSTSPPPPPLPPHTPGSASLASGTTLLPLPEFSDGSGAIVNNSTASAASAPPRKNIQQQQSAASRSSLDTLHDGNHRRAATKGQPGGFLENLFSGKRRRKSKERNGDDDTDEGEGCLEMFNDIFCIFVPKSSAYWYDERYGEIGKSQIYLQLFLCLIITLLVLFDVVKFVGGPDPIEAMLKEQYNRGAAGANHNETLEKAYVFFVPCAITLLMFGSFPILLHTKILDVTNLEQCKIVIACFYIVTGVSFTLTEIATGWYGFADSTIWVLVGWVFTRSPFGFRASFSVSIAIALLYTISLIIGLDTFTFAVLSTSTLTKLLQLYMLLFLPNALIALWIEAQIEQAAQLTRVEEEGIEDLQDTLEYGNRLLETVLPKDIIKWVKSMAQVKDAAIAHKYESCSITFIKFVGIHYLFENQPTVEVIKTINKLYRRIDRLTDPMHLVEKIKTVGDVYMAASGIPSPNNLHAVIINDFCFDVVEEVRRFSIRYKVKLSFKIGISSGPIVAGVIGKNKFTYDLWGDAANTASRMYAFGQKGKIQTTQATVDLIKDYYHCTHQGIKNIKGKGLMPVFFVEGRLDSYKKNTRASKFCKVDSIQEKYLTRNDAAEGSRDPFSEQFAKSLENGEVGNIERKGAMWIPDSHHKACMECQKPFTFSKRRHHCRYCGRLLCNDCTRLKLRKLRACNRCFQTYQNTAERNVFLYQSDLRRIAEKKGKAHHNFANPYMAMYHCCRSGTSRSLEFEYLVKRKIAVRSLLLYLWFLLLLVCVLGNHVVNDFLLPFRCINVTSGKARDCDNYDTILKDDGTNDGTSCKEEGTECYGQVGQIAMYTSQTAENFQTPAKRQSLGVAIDAITQSQGVNTTKMLATAIADAAAAEPPKTIVDTTYTKIVNVTEYHLPFFGFFEDNKMVFASYTTAGSDIAPMFGMERVMYAKTMFAFGILPMFVAVILISMLDYKVKGENKDFLKHMSAEITRDPGKPAPGMYSKEDHTWIGLQIGALFIVMTVLGVCAAAQSAYGGGVFHGYLFLFITWTANICNDVPAFYCLMVTIVWTCSYLGFILADAPSAARLANQLGSAHSTTDSLVVSDLLTFFVEKFLPITILAVLAGHKLESKTRFQFTKQLAHRDTMRTAEVERRKNMELVPLPQAIRDIMRKSEQEGEAKQIVIDAFGSVLFADIVSFTVFSTGMDPMNLVLVLNEMFSLHDSLATRLGVDKIKTLGDCYVASTGLLAPLPNHAALLCRFGIGMHDVMDKLNTKFDLHDKGPFGKDLRIRVGIATGTVVGGVVGMKKFLFDIWGDTVEQSELMESEGVPERVHIAQSTYDRACKDDNLQFVVAQENKDFLKKHPNGKIDGYNEKKSYLAKIPNRIPEWLDELYPLPKSLFDEDQDDDKKGKKKKSKKKSKKNSRNSQTPGRNGNTPRLHARTPSYGELLKQDPGSKQAGKTARFSLKRGDSMASNFDDSAALKEIEMSELNSDEKEAALGDTKASTDDVSGESSGLSRTPSMQVVLNDIDDIEFQGIPSFDDAKKKPGQRKRNTARLKKRRQFRASFYGGPPAATEGTKESHAKAASEAYTKQREQGDGGVVDEVPVDMMTNPMV